MKSNERISMVAPCGIDCGICELHICKDNPRLYDQLITRGIPKDKIPCAGCRNIEGMCPVHPTKCATYTCVTERKVDFCYECSDFPCEKLQPAADRAEILPHNTKVFNLCTIKNFGLEHFLKKSGEIKLKYYKGKMGIGEGPQIEN